MMKTNSKTRKLHRDLRNAQEVMYDLYSAPEARGPLPRIGSADAVRPCQPEVIEAAWIAHKEGRRSERSCGV
jgi:hypothetical protein